jgi:putative peptide zinc metalloprotease protein
MAVDAGGIFMSLLIANCFAACALLGGTIAFLVLAYLSSVVVIFSLNPFIRLDGYWLLSDALGVPNLMQMNRQVVVWTLSRLLGMTRPIPAILRSDVRFWRRAVYLAYAVTFAVFAILAAGAFAFWYLPSAVVGFPALIHGLPERIADAGTGFARFEVILRFASDIFVFSGLLVYLGRGLHWLVRRYTGEARQNAPQIP